MTFCASPSRGRAPPWCTGRYFGDSSCGVVFCDQLLVFGLRFPPFTTGPPSPRRGASFKFQGSTCGPPGRPVSAKLLQGRSDRTPGSGTRPPSGQERQLSHALGAAAEHALGDAADDIFFPRVREEGERSPSRSRHTPYVMGKHKSTILTRQMTSLSLSLPGLGVGRVLPFPRSLLLSSSTQSKRELTADNSPSRAGTPCLSQSLCESCRR